MDVGGDISLGVVTVIALHE